ncbi:MAG: hypothetical protein AAGE89_06005 [Pseudomonadota bacterium]
MIIVENGTFELFYDHWAANKLDTELFWGPEFARAFIEERDARPGYWVDDGWSEGGCILDFDSLHLLWYGGQDVRWEANLNLVHAELMARQWPDWHVEWAKNGVFDFVDKLGVPRETVAGGRDLDVRELSQPMFFEDKAGGYSSAEAVVSYRSNNQSRVAILAGESLSCASDGLTKASLMKLVDDFDLKTFQEHIPPAGQWDGIVWGIHFDFDDHDIKIWYPRPEEELPDRLEEKWPSFEVTHCGPDYLWHKDMFPMLEWAEPDHEATKRVLSMIRGSLDADTRNPAFSIVEALKEHKPDSKIELSAEVLHHRERDTSLTGRKYEILKQLEASLYH